LIFFFSKKKSDDATSRGETPRQSRGMISAALLFVPLLASAAAVPNPLQLSLRADGSYSLTHASWPALSLTSGATTVRVSGAVLSSADGSLVLSGAPAVAQGADAWGAYNETTLSWAAASAPSSVLMATSVAVYADAPAVAFSAAFPLGVAQTGAAVKDKDGLVATFPSWVPPASGPLGWMQWAGAFINNGLGGPNFGAFTAAGAAKLAGGVASGPLVLFDESAAASLMLSASSQFMATSTAAVGGQLALGPMGSFAALPAGFAYSTVAWAGEGINHAVAAWGDALMRKFGKPHGLSKSDFTNTHLIYNTDHGAYYYYETGAFLNYSQALDAVYEYSVQVGIPYRGVLLDSWWYFKGTGGGVKNVSERACAAQMHLLNLARPAHQKTTRPPARLPRSLLSGRPCRPSLPAAMTAFAPSLSARTGRSRRTTAGGVQTLTTPSRMAARTTFSWTLRPRASWPCRWSSASGPTC